MVERIGCDCSLLGVVVEHADQQVIALIVKDLDGNVVLLAQVWYGLVLRHLHGLHVGQLAVARPYLVVGRAEVLEDAVYHFYLLRSIKQWSLVAQLKKDTANGPHVDGYRVLCGSEEELRCSVPECHDFAREGSHGHREGAREPKICDLELPVLPDEDVLRLEIPVHDSVRVALVDAQEDLTEVALDVLHGQPLYARGRAKFPLLIHQVGQVAVAPLEDEEDLVELWNDILQFHQVGMVGLAQLHEGRYLSKDLSGNSLAPVC